MRFVRAFVTSAGVTSIAAGIVVVSLGQASFGQSADTQQQNSSQSKDSKKDPDQIGTRQVDKGLNWYSINQEIALGKAWAQQIQQNAQVVDDPMISEYVNRVGQNLGRNSDLKFPLIIKVIRDDSPNALSLPGGFVFVNTGLILTAGSEAELAGGMAHEIAHVAARHVTREMTRQRVMQLATIPLIFMGGWAGYGASQGAGVMLPIEALHFQRAFESEADLLGLEYMYKTGYDPEGMVDIFEKINALLKQKPNFAARWFSDHPYTQDRIEAAQKNIQDLLKPRPEYVVTTSEFDDVKARLMILERKRKPKPDNDPNRPQLRRAPDRKMAGNRDTPAGVWAYNVADLKGVY